MNAEARDYLTTTDATHLTITDGVRFLTLDFTAEPTDAPVMGSHWTDEWCSKPLPGTVWDAHHRATYSILTGNGPLTLGSYDNSRAAVRACYEAVA